MANNTKVSIVLNDTFTAPGHLQSQKENYQEVFVGEYPKSQRQAIRKPLRPCLHEDSTKLDRHKKCSDQSEIIPAAESKRVSSDRHKLGSVQDFRHVNTNYFQTGLCLNKVHASHVHTYVCMKDDLQLGKLKEKTVCYSSSIHAHNVVWWQNVRKEFRLGVI